MSEKEKTKEGTQEVKPLPETRKEILRRLFLANNLVAEDVFKHAHYTIITRQGIDKIQAAQSIEIRYELAHLSEDHSHCLIKAFGKMGDKIIETYGEATPKNNKNAYTVAMAEKRAMSRIVLKLSGFYENGFFGEDESDDFKR
jgi:hypothetical protein